jgi:hypothetical protein
MGLRLGRGRRVRTGLTALVSLLRGLIAGLLIAALQVTGGHVWIDYQKFSFHGNGLIAVAVPVFLLPLAIAWGWTWVSSRWSGRSGPRLLAYTVGLILGAGAAFPAEYVLFTPESMFDVWLLLDYVVLGMLFVLPVVAFAAIFYWAFASERVRASFGTLALGYLGGLFLALLLPTLTMGAVAGTAAGHSWQRPGARGAVSFLVVLLMLVGVFELPMAAASPSITLSLP